MTRNRIDSQLSYRVCVVNRMKQTPPRKPRVAAFVVSVATMAGVISGCSTTGSSPQATGTSPTLAMSDTPTTPTSLTTLTSWGANDGATERVPTAQDATTQVEGVTERIPQAQSADPVAIGGTPATTGTPSVSQPPSSTAAPVNPAPTTTLPKPPSTTPASIVGNNGELVVAPDSASNYQRISPNAAPKPARPEGLRPTRIRVATIGVNAAIQPVGLTAAKALDVPRNVSVPGWWKGGRVPGEAGPTVIVGHVDSKRGPGVFSELRTLRAGDKVQIEQSDGSQFTYVIDRVEVHKKKAFPTAAVYGATDSSTLRLITCGGPFNARTGHYIDNVIAYGDLEI
jgi:LPXTG-site transpeptidase (sortase) family protein